MRCCLLASARRASESDAGSLTEPVCAELQHGHVIACPMPVATSLPAGPKHASSACRLYTRSVLKPSVDCDPLAAPCRHVWRGVPRSDVTHGGGGCCQSLAGELCTQQNEAGRLSSWRSHINGQTQQTRTRACIRRQPVLRCALRPAQPNRHCQPCLAPCAVPCFGAQAGEACDPGVPHCSQHKPPQLRGHSLALHHLSAAAADPHTRVQVGSSSSSGGLTQASCTGRRGPARWCMLAAWRWASPSQQPTWWLGGNTGSLPACTPSCCFCPSYSVRPPPLTSHLRAAAAAGGRTEAT